MRGLSADRISSTNYLARKHAPDGRFKHAEAEQHCQEPASVMCTRAHMDHEDGTLHTWRCHPRDAHAQLRGTEWRVHSTSCKRSSSSRRFLPCPFATPPILQHTRRPRCERTEVLNRHRCRCRTRWPGLARCPPSPARLRTFAACPTRACRPARTATSRSCSTA